MERIIPPKRLSWPEMLEILTDSERKSRTVIERTTELERMALFLLRREGWTAKALLHDIFDLELFKPGERIAVKLKNSRAKSNLNNIESFHEALNQPENAHFSGGFYVSSSGFTPSVYSFLREEGIDKIRLGIIRNERLIWDTEKYDSPREKDRATYIGVFTCKGGVGKTTVSAHLAGAFAMNGYDVGLIDLDPQQNLHKLLGEGLYLPSSGSAGESKVSIYNRYEWDQIDYQKNKIVICDCSPDFGSNPLEMIRKFDYCLIPTTLNPLGINKNADVIKQTFRAIRNENSKAELFVLINNLHRDEANRNEFLSQILKSQFKRITENDDQCNYIDPRDACIRFSKQLLYWGFHLFEDGPPSLAFHSRGGRSFPRSDFLKLVDYLEMQTEIRESKPFKFAA